LFTRTTAINKILKLNKFCNGVQGGTSAGKTYGILPVLIDIATKNPNTEISIVAESFPHLRRGAMKDFKKIMYETGRWIDSHWHATDSTYTLYNKSTFEFFSADNDSKLRGARRDILYMNEANNMTFHAYTELASRTKQRVYLDWNPVASFWFHEELQNDSDVEMLIINYLDNEACPDSALKFILKAKEKASESAFWSNWYNVYGLGIIGSLQGAVFENWQQCKEIPIDAEFIAYGMDFGFSADPTTLVGVYRYNKELYLKELIYETKLTNTDIIEKLNTLGINKRDVIIADSAEPKSIEDLKRAGYNVEPAKKGADSIKHSIDTLQRYKLNITDNSINGIKEARNYKWLTDKDGKSTNKPIDSFNHFWDAVRYVALNKIDKPNSKIILD
jgi:phage terminase large subunit